MPPSFIVATDSIREYFLEAVSSALKHQSLVPDEATSSYLVDLLCEFAIGAKIDLEQALAFILAESLISLPSQSIDQLKQVGDHSLYVSGFFSDSLRRSKIDLDYYLVLGATAYKRLSRTFRRLGGRNQLVIVYSELGQEFARFVEVLTDVRNQSAHPIAAPNIAELYEEWLRTGDETASRKLQAAGVLTVRRPGTKQ
jgi:hypothetical protein